MNPDGSYKVLPPIADCADCGYDMHPAGSPRLESRGRKVPTWRVVCPKCGQKRGITSRTKYGAITSWNQAQEPRP
jgi:hypothetical protein